MGNPSKHRNDQQHLNKYAIRCLAVVATICLIVLSGWVFDSLIFASFNESFTPMAPSAAVLFIMLCGTLFTHLRWPTRRFTRHATRWTALLVASISAVIFADYFIDAIDLNIEGLFFFITGKSDVVPAGRMSPITTGGFTLASSATLFLSISSRNKRLRWVPPFLATSVAMVGLVLLIGYLDGSPFLYGGKITPVALPTAISFFAFGVGLCAATGPEAFPQRLFLGESIRSRMTRAFLPVMVAIVLIHGMLDARLYTRITNPSLISSLMTLLSLAIVTLLIATISRVISSKIERAELEQKLAEQRLSENEELLRSFYENTIDAMFVGCPDGTIFSANPEASRIFGMSKEEICAVGWEGLVERDKFQSALDERMQVGRYRGELVCRRKDGTSFPVEVSSSIFIDKAGHKKTTVTLRDTTERDQMQKEIKEANEILKLLSNTDPLTHLYNRRFLMESLDRELNRQKRKIGHLTLAIFDVDHFKLINDVYGHQFGDTVLVAIAEAAQVNLRSYEFAARYGGDEFVLLLPETDLLGGVVVAERLREAVHAMTFKPPAENLSVTISVGVASFSFPSPSIDGIDSLITKADEALYQAKGNGRNRVEVMATSF